MKEWRQSWLSNLPKATEWASGRALNRNAVFLNSTSSYPCNCWAWLISFSVSVSTSAKWVRVGFPHRLIIRREWEHGTWLTLGVEHGRSCIKHHRKPLCHGWDQGLAKGSCEQGEQKQNAVLWCWLTELPQSLLWMTNRNQADHSVEFL